MSNANIPGINLYFSHSVERLADLLSEKIHAQQAHTGPFVSVDVLVPNSNMQRYLQLHVAERKGVCAQVEFPFLETGLFQLTRKSTNQNQAHLNGTLLGWNIWSYLKQLDSQKDAAFEPIFSYINEQGSAGLIARKQFQLSQKLAMLLLDYESQRPEMVRLWQSNKLVFKNSKDQYLAQLEVMQQKLYQKIVQADDSHKTLLQMANDLQQANVNEVEPAIHIFTPSRISQLHRQLMLQLAEFMPVNIYQLNVCMEYWEDMQTKGESNWYQSQLSQMARLKVEITDDNGHEVGGDDTGSELFSELLLNPDDNDLLQAWGKPGREALKLFSEIEYDAAHFSIEFNDHWFESEHSEQSVLKKIQSHIINRTPQAQAVISVQQLNSLQFAVAPSIVREVEATYNSILWNLKQDPELKLNDIVVLVTDMSKYRYVLEQVFESFNHQHHHQLNYAIVDSNANVESQYASAVMDLLKVLEDDFIRASLFEWFDNPCVQEANHFNHDDWHDWLQAVDKLGIYCGYETLYEVDDEAKSRLFTWQNGLKTLRKSLVIDDENSSIAAFLSHEKIGQLSLMIESLNGYQQRLKNTHSTTQWERIINEMLETLITVPAEKGQEQVVQMTLQQSLQKLAKAQPKLLLNYQDIKLFIQHQLQEIPANRGNYLSGGVICAALQPMRPIPFKITYILGMDEKSFPGQLSKETLDLTNRSRRIGDINSIENNQYLFLETLMCSRQKLYLSYVGTDLVKDEVIEPSPVFITLKNYCDSLVDFDAFPYSTYPISQIPLNSQKNVSFDDMSIKHTDWLINFSYSDFLLHQSQYKVVEFLAPSTSSQQRIKTIFQAQLEREITPQESALEQDQFALKEISADDLAQYLANPQIAILKQLGIAIKHDDDLSLVDHEPVKLLPLVKHKIFTQAIYEWLKQPITADYDQLLKHQYLIELNKSKAPLEIFAGLNQLSQVTTLLDKKLKSKLIDKTYIGRVQMGDIEASENPGIQADAIKFDLGLEQNVEIIGSAAHVFSAGEILTDMVVVSSSSKDAKWNSKLLSPFINWCLWQLSPSVRVAESFHVHMVFPKQIRTVVLQPWYANEVSFSSQSTIRKYLQNLIQNFMHGEDEFMPVELASQLKLSDKSEAKSINFSGHANKVFMAYDELTAADKAQLLDLYSDKLNWPDYEEVLKVIEINQSEQPWEWIQSNLLPLFAMVNGKFKGSDRDLS